MQAPWLSHWNPTLSKTFFIEHTDFLQCKYKHVTHLKHFNDFLSSEWSWILLLCTRESPLFSLYFCRYISWGSPVGLVLYSAVLQAHPDFELHLLFAGFLLGSMSSRMLFLPPFLFLYKCPFLVHAFFLQLSCITNDLFGSVLVTTRSLTRAEIVFVWPPFGVTILWAWAACTESLRD